ncbi:hypothetical protein BT96DRAFT_1024412 [Gymnopus androsaceus JB14]|uniref:Uncharacterized protein n=1 Tax=Gymnopus androsaceus JB14 TaxID=1447944 RepID=A0A6A4GXX8_9AGAR|nr:hypothetical protein BT96DRAFT_1024412 [Gymnopus androsaceus JB14]
MRFNYLSIAALGLASAVERSDVHVVQEVTPFTLAEIPGGEKCNEKEIKTFKDQTNNVTRDPTPTRGGKAVKARKYGQNAPYLNSSRDGLNKNQEEATFQSPAHRRSSSEEGINRIHLLAEKFWFFWGVVRTFPDDHRVPILLRRFGLEQVSNLYKSLSRISPSSEKVLFYGARRGSSASLPRNRKEDVISVWYPLRLTVHPCRAFPTQCQYSCRANSGALPFSGRRHRPPPAHINILLSTPGLVLP